MKCETCQTTICVRTPEGSPVKVGYQDSCVILDVDQSKICTDGPCGPSVQTLCRTFAPDNYPGPITYINECPCPRLVSISATGLVLNGTTGQLNASAYIDGQAVQLGTYPPAIAARGTTAHFRQDLIVYPGSVLTYEPYIDGVFDRVFYTITSY